MKKLTEKEDMQSMSRNRGKDESTWKTQEDHDMYMKAKYMSFDLMAPYLWSAHEIASRRSDIIRGMDVIPAMHENVMAELSEGRYFRTDCIGYDESDFSESKHITALLRPNDPKKNLWRYSAVIQNVSTKIGLLRVTICDPYNDCHYYLAIPHSAYKHITSKQSTKDRIEVVIQCFSGYDRFTRPTPNKLLSRDSKWGQYQVNSLKELSMKECVL
jgi:hypothetical protein